MEKSFGLTKLTPVERDVLYVIESLSEKADPIASQEILSHDLTLGVSRPTIYRALNRLLEEQLIRKSPVAERGFFTRLRNLPES
jgi:Fe2+ or Zn2+ uptake regulation protein